MPLPPDDEITDDTRIQDGGDLPTYTKAIRKNTRKHSQTEQSLSDANITDDMRRREDDNLPTYAKVMKKSMPKITQPEKVVLFF